MTKWTVWVGCLALACVMVTPAFGERAGDYRPFVPSPGSDPYRPTQFLRVAGETTWVQVHVDSTICAPGPNENGGLGTGGPDLTETWCFEGLYTATHNEDSCGTFDNSGSGGVDWTTNCFEVHEWREPEQQPNYFHADTYRAFSGQSLWAGTIDGKISDSCAIWSAAPGYGAWTTNAAVLNLGPKTEFNAEDGFTLSCKMQYDLECNYDYAFLDFSFDGGGTWVPDGLTPSTSIFINGTSGSVPTSTLDACGMDYIGEQSGLGTGKDYTNPVWVDFLLDWSDSVFTNQQTGDFLVRFRFESDPCWDDHDLCDSGSDTEGALYIDNLVLTADLGGTNSPYTDDFDAGVSGDWSFPPPALLGTSWKIRFDPDPPQETEDGVGPGGVLPTCDQNGTWVWNTAPMKQYDATDKWLGTDWLEFQMHLFSPKIPVAGQTGMIVQYDEYLCMNVLSTITNDTAEQEVRVYDTSTNTWCGWETLARWVGGCAFWNLNSNDNYGSFMGPTIDSLQVRWAHVDNCWADITAPCRGRHKFNDYIIDNVSIGFFDFTATTFSIGRSSLFSDTYDLLTCAHSSALGNSEMPRDSLHAGDSLVVDVSDIDGLPADAVTLHYTIDGGQNWQSHLFDFAKPSQGSDPDDHIGTYRASICPSQLPGAPTQWTPGTEVLYYITAVDKNAETSYAPRAAGEPLEEDRRYYEFSVLPFGNRILFVDDFGDWQWVPDYANGDTVVSRTRLFYNQVLDSMGYEYDQYDVSSGSGGQREPWTFTVGDSLLYDAIIWTTNRLDLWCLRDTTQLNLRDYVNKGGKLAFFGASVAFDLATPDPDDTLWDDIGNFLAGYLGASYLGKHANLEQDLYGMADQVTDGLSAHAYANCPLIHDNWDSLNVNQSPPAFADPDTFLIYADGSIAGITNTINVIEGKTGQVVFCNTDLSLITQLGPRTELMYRILNDEFGIPAPYGLRTGSPAPGTAVAFGLDQNTPNPFNPATTISFSLADRMPVRLAVYNIAGQVVRTLLSDPVEAGSHSILWDGTDDAGKAVSSGVYFYKLEANGGVETKKMILLR